MRCRVCAAGGVALHAQPIILAAKPGDLRRPIRNARHGRRRFRGHRRPRMLPPWRLRQLRRIEGETPSSPAISTNRRPLPASRAIASCLELIPKVTPFLTHSTPSRSSRSLPKVSTNPGEAQSRQSPPARSTAPSRFGDPATVQVDPTADPLCPPGAPHLRGGRSGPPVHARIESPCWGRRPRVRAVVLPDKYPHLCVMRHSPDPANRGRAAIVNHRHGNARDSASGEHRDGYRRRMRQDRVGRSGSAAAGRAAAGGAAPGRGRPPLGLFERDRDGCRGQGAAARNARHVAPRRRAAVRRRAVQSACADRRAAARSRRQPRDHDAVLFAPHRAGAADSRAALLSALLPPGACRGGRPAGARRRPVRRRCWWCRPMPPAWSGCCRSSSRRCARCCRPRRSCCATTARRGASKACRCTAGWRTARSTVR